MGTTERVIEGLPDETTEAAADLCEGGQRGIRGAAGRHVALRQCRPGRISPGSVQPEHSPPGVIVRQRRPQAVQRVAPPMEQGADRGPSLSDGRRAAHVGSGISTRVSGDPGTASRSRRARSLHRLSREDRSAERGRGPGFHESCYYGCVNAMWKGAEATKPRRFCCRSRSPRRFHCCAECNVFSGVPSSLTPMR